MTHSQLRVLARTLGILAFGVCFALALEHSSVGDRAPRLTAAPLPAVDSAGPAPARVPPILVGADATPAAASTPFVGMPMVGALFTTGQGGRPGGHFCTGSVVDSPGGNVVVTAAHCLEDPANGSTTVASFVFVPGYHDGQEPYGEWTPVKVFIDPHWTADSNPDYDYAFVVLRKTGDPKARLSSLVGAEHVSFDTRLPVLVGGIGYPEGTEQPIACLNTLKPYQPTQSEFDCGGFTDGSSGGPMLMGLDATTGRGSVIGVIGGYEEGGFTPEVSYAAAFGAAAQGLYQQAIAVP